MGFFAIEHGTAAYRADFALYASTVALLSAAVLASVPSSRWAEPAGLVAAGWIGWTAIEYLLHRFVLHGLMPFRRWHEEHHRRPNALICTPTILSASLVVVLVFLPTLALAGTWQACALTLGVVTGYLVYAVTHHATHHWRSGGRWLARRKRWHALHHRAGSSGGYGVTSAFWDLVFGSGPVAARPSKPK